MFRGCDDIRGTFPSVHAEVWGFGWSFLCCSLLEFVPHLHMRLPRADELAGLDFCEHGINPGHHLDYQFREELHLDAEKGKAAPLLHAHPPQLQLDMLACGRF